VNEQTLMNAEQLIARSGHGSERALRERIAELEEENRLLRSGEHKAEQIRRTIDADLPNLDKPELAKIAAERLLRLPADALAQHEGLQAWKDSFEEREGIDFDAVPDELAGPLVSFARVLD
jgi:hypothetical protein